MTRATVLAVVGQLLGGILSAFTKSAVTKEHSHGLYSNAEDCHIEWKNKTCIVLHMGCPFVEVKDNYCQDDYAYLFSYAWSLTLITFTGKACCLFVHAWHIHSQGEGPTTLETDVNPISDREQDAKNFGANSDEELSTDSQSPYSTAALPSRGRPNGEGFRIPYWPCMVSIAGLDLSGSGFGAMGLTYGVQTTMYCVVKASKTVFVAILRSLLTFLNPTSPHLESIVLNCAQWSGILVIVAAVALQGATGAEDKAGSNDTIGFLLCLLGEASHAAQVVVEEYTVKVHRVSPFVVTGLPAVFGLLFAGLVCAILSQVTVTVKGVTRASENPWDALVLASNSLPLRPTPSALEAPYSMWLLTGVLEIPLP